MGDFTPPIGQVQSSQEQVVTPAGNGHVGSHACLAASSLDSLGILEEKPAPLLEPDTQAWPGHRRRGGGGAGEGGALQPVPKSCALREATAHVCCALPPASRPPRGRTGSVAWPTITRNTEKCILAQMTHHNPPLYRWGTLSPTEARGHAQEPPVNPGPVEQTVGGQQ